MQLSRFVVPVFLVAVIATAACAHPATSGTANDAPAAARIQSPRMLRGESPRLRSPGSFNAKIEVVIGVNGQPDMTTLQITGSMSGDVRFALRDWIQQSQFEPGKQGGIAVPAVFKMELSARAR